MKSEKPVLVVSLFFALAAIAGCASTKVTTKEYSEPRQKLEAASQMGAAELPQASLHLRLAQEQIEVADVLIADEEYEEARYALMRAEADAELALAMAREERMRGEVSEIVEKIQKLRADTR